MKKILIIEDESGIQRVLSESLSKEGYIIFSALDGEDGLRIAKREMPDLILLDLILPRRDGFEVLTELKKDDTKNIPIIVLSNLEGNVDVQRALELGATTYLVKTNYKLLEVIEKIKKALK